MQFRGLISILRLSNLRGHSSGIIGDYFIEYFIDKLCANIECAAVTDVDVKVSGVKLFVRG